MFSQQFYSQNRKKLIDSLPNTVIVIAANGLLQRSGDTNFTFRQDSNFLYLTGISEPDLLLVLNSATGDEYIVVPDKDEIAEIFDGVSDWQQIQKQSGIAKVVGEKEGWAYIRAHASKGQVSFNMPTSAKSRELFVNPNRRRVFERLKKLNQNVNDVRPQLASQRVIKQPAEIAAIQQAITVTYGALAIAQQSINSAATEKDLLRVINIEFANQDTVHAYEPIVAAGNNATTLHYVKNNAPIHSGDAVLFDVGAEVSGYAADISRTYIKGENKRASEVVEAVKSIQTELIAHIKPGVTWKFLSETALELTAQQLIKLNVITDKKDAQKYFPHAFGHFLGLDVHDVGGYSQPLAENMVLTVEPGIYIAKEGIGVRIEDDILITKTGAKLL
jgi:Xaa-Pro aminopeptidase